MNIVRFLVFMLSIIFFYRVKLISWKIIKRRYVLESLDLELQLNISLFTNKKKSHNFLWNQSSVNKCNKGKLWVRDIWFIVSLGNDLLVLLLILLFCNKGWKNWVENCPLLPAFLTKHIYHSIYKKLIRQADN